MKNEPLNILVLGVGGNVSQGILKALQISTLRCRIISACVDHTALGLFTTDRSYLSPYASSSDFLPWLFDLCAKESIDAILTGVEPIIDVLSINHNALFEKTGAICVINAPESIAIASDKLKTCEWLKTNGFNYPLFAATEDESGLNDLLSEKGFPLICKPRHGKGSAGILIINDDKSLAAARLLKTHIIQELLGNDESEFTASFFSDKNDRLRGIITFRRSLQHGTTFHAEAGEYPLIRDEVRRIASVLRPRGSCNVQLRLHDGRPVCFEINARFSGTTPMRARLGFNDVEASLRHYVLEQPAYDLPHVTSGSVIRYWNEAYISTNAISNIKCNKMLIKSEYNSLLIEDYGIIK